MSRGFSFANLMIVAVFLLSAIATKAAFPYDYMKLSIQWPISHCNTKNMVIVKRIRCLTPILGNFTIHGFWPMYLPDVEVPSYYDDKRCVTSRTRPIRFSHSDQIEEIIDVMKKYWPDVTSYNHTLSNTGLWMYQWKKHGMCSKYPRNVILYFKTALAVIKQYDFLKILEEAHIFPDGGEYDRSAINDAITKALGSGVRADIQCNEDYKRTIQLSEIRICFDREDVKMSCPTSFRNCKNESTKITFSLPSLVVD